MENERSEARAIYVNPTNDLAFRKTFGSEEHTPILAGFIKDFFFIEPTALAVENPYSIKAYREMLKDKVAANLRATISDVAATMDFADYRLELQLRKDINFNERSLYYPLNKFVNRYGVVKQEGEKSGYARLRPIYSMSVLGYNHFNGDDDALRIFQLYDIKRNKRFPKDILNLGYFELLKPNVETDNQRHWQDYFLQRPLSDDAPSYIKDALDIIKRVNMKEEELDMVIQAEHLQSLYEDTIAYAKNEGIAEGRAEGKAEIKVEIAKSMLLEGYPTDAISKLTGIGEQEILELKGKMRL